MNRTLVSVSLGVSVLLFLAAPAAGQQIKKNGWQVDIHGGFLPGSSSTAGTGALPPAGESFTTNSNQPSRFVPSYYFGDGAALMNTAVSSNSLTLSRIVPLDGILTTGSGQRQAGRAFGFRIGHTVTSHAVAEFSMDMAQSRVTLSNETRAAIEAGRSSFKAVFDGILVNSAANAVTTSTVDIQDDRGSQMSMIGSVNINVVTVGRFTPFVTAGGGLMLSRGSSSDFTMVGQYKFTLNNPGSFANGAAFGDTDSVTVNYGVPSAFIKVFGGGVQMRLSGRSGVRADVRAYLAGLTIDVETNSTIPEGPISATVTRGTNGPQVQFTAGNSPSSLMGSQDSFTTFKGSGTIVSATFGYYVRF